MRMVGFVFGSILMIIAIGILMMQDKKVETNVTLHRTKVAVIMNGSRNDHSWSESHYEAMEKVADRLNLEVLYYENVSEDSLTERIMESAIKKGARIVVANSFGFGKTVMRMAEKYPGVKFIHASGIDYKSNVSTFFGRIYQMRYLSGIVAGLTTKTNEIGYVAAFDISEVNRGINAFALGVAKVNPEAKVFVGWSRSWEDSALAADATNDLINKHNIDVLTVHVDALSPYDIAEHRNIRMIGYNLDNGNRFPRTFMTAPVWRWENYYSPKIMAILQDKFVGDHAWLGVDSDIIGLAPMTALVPDSARKIVDVEFERLKSGAYDVFYGPIEDNHGDVRVNDGESMTDVDMLEHFDWYVKGVVNE